MQHLRALGVLNEHGFAAEFEHRNKMDMLSPSLLRGLDIESSIVLVDALHNGDRDLAKTLMSRCCETSKLVLAGGVDPVQIDTSLDRRSNALTRVKQTYKWFGSVVAQMSLENNDGEPISQTGDELSHPGPLTRRRRDKAQPPVTRSDTVKIRGELRWTATPGPVARRRRLRR